MPRFADRALSLAKVPRLRRTAAAGRSTSQRSVTAAAFVVLDPRGVFFTFGGFRQPSQLGAGKCNTLFLFEPVSLPLSASSASASFALGSLPSMLFGRLWGGFLLQTLEWHLWLLATGCWLLAVAC